MPLCHFHYFFEVFAFCSHFLKAAGAPIWTSIRFHPTNQCRKVFAAPSLLPEPIFWQRFDAFSPKSQSRFQPNALLQFFILMLCCPLLPIDCSGLLPKHFLHIFWANISHVNSSVAFEYQGVLMRPLDTQITGLARHCSCRSAHLHSHLNFSNLYHPSFSLSVIPFSRQKSSCTSRPNASMNKDNEVVLFFVRCCCHLRPPLQSFCRDRTYCMHSPRPRWHHIRS